jgi:hypothetical protein
VLPRNRTRVQKEIQSTKGYDLVDEASSPEEVVYDARKTTRHGFK